MDLGIRQVQAVDSGRGPGILEVDGTTFPTRFAQAKLLQ